MSRSKLVYWGILIVFVACVAVASEIYTWTDNNGVVHYSDEPNSQTAKVVTVTKVPPVTTGNATTNAKAKVNQSSTYDTVQGSSEPQVATPQEQQQAIDAQKQTQQYCEAAKKNLAVLQETGRRVYTVSSSGQYHYFNDQERQQQIQKTEETIRLNCGKSS